MTPDQGLVKQAEKEPDELLEIHADPSLDEVWDLCVRNYLYDQEAYTDQVEAILKELGITKESRLADVSAGGGFPAINLIQRGYKIDCFDGFADQLFNDNAKKLGVDADCKKLLWQDIPEVVPEAAYDFVFCRGNSFIFAGGGWDETAKGVDLEQVRQKYADTMKIFANMIKPGGGLYIDKFKDSELGHREKLATIKVGGQPQDLIFSSQRSPEDKLRRVYMERVVGDEVVVKETRITYDLSGEELVGFMKDAGFSEVEKTEVSEEKHFDVWLGKK